MCVHIESCMCVWNHACVYRIMRVYGKAIGYRSKKTNAHWVRVGVSVSSRVRNGIVVGYRVRVGVGQGEVRVRLGVGLGSGLG